MLTLDDYPSQNAALGAAAVAVQDEIAQGLTALRQLERWIGLHIPKVEDGGNFGVQVLQDVLKLVREAQKTLDGLFSKSCEFAGERSKALGDLLPKQTREQTRTESKTDATGGKDGDESKTSDSTSTVTKER